MKETFRQSLSAVSLTRLSELKKQQGTVHWQKEFIDAEIQAKKQRRKTMTAEQAYKGNTTPYYSHFYMRTKA
jgi:hypothetical protein